MMNSDNIKTHLSEYVDGTLSKALKKEIDAFLETDPESKTLFEGAIIARKSMQALKPHTVSDDFELRLREKINSHKTITRPQFTRRRTFSLAVSGAVLTAAVYMFVFTESSIQQNQDNTIVPSSMGSVGTNYPAVEEKAQTPVEENVVTDSTKINENQEVNREKIHLTGEQ